MKRQPEAWRLRYLLASVGVSVTGDGVMLAAAPLLAASLTKDPLWVACVSGSGSLAWMIVGLPAGALVDRMPLRLTMMIADIIRALTLFLLGALVLVGRITLPWLLVGVFLVGAGSCFFDPAAQATIPALVSHRRPALDRANSYLWSVDAVARSLAGPPIGAALFQASRTLPFVADAFSFLASAAFITRLPKQQVKSDEHPPIVESITNGMRFAVASVQLRALSIGLGIYNAGWNTAMATFVLFTGRQLRAGAAGYGLLLACSALGAVISGWLTPAVMRRIDAGQAFSAVLVLQALSWAAVFWSSHAWQVALALFVVGASTNMVSIVSGTARQYLSPPELIGRIVAASRLFSIGSAVVGAMIGGVVAHIFGLRAPFAVSAGLLVMGAALVWLPLHAAHLKHS